MHCFLVFKPSIALVQLTANNRYMEKLINEKESNCMETIMHFHDKNRCKRSCFVDGILMEVKRRKDKGEQANLFSEKECKVFSVKTEKKLLKKYGLGSKYGSTYFTKREAECIVGLLQEKTIYDVAMILGISPRMVMEYLESMRAKIGCRTTSELIDLVRASEFLKNVDF